ncbi:hypothetical protein SAMN02745111_00667 [Eubacterium uniforme]|uniref:Uncharacterized protein n=1 Tax=Eubacterium uniforme TaxID=39495 RepID=A0A1T4VCF9_9FIRM|nr:hypothetical protein [Eubacterium uniforme]SKA62654.1 hypothetical protein SAMN02745111_00667 [Eubacterium uniforme]HAV90394.1 hypothetical protein [Eubacterium sp.]
MNKYLSRAIKVVASLLIFTIIFNYLFGVRGVMKMATDVTNVPYYNTFYDLPKNTVDGIVLGNSVAHRGWSDVTAWNESGMTVYSLATESQPIPLTKYIIEEALKTQDLKFVVIELHGMRGNMFYYPSETFLRRITDIMPMSKNKVETSKAAYEYYNKIADYRENVLKRGASVEIDEASLYLPFLKYHSRWQDLEREDFIDCTSDTMSTYSAEHMCEIADVEPLPNDDKFGYTEEASGLGDYQVEAFADLLDYLKKKDLQAIFVSFPSKLSKIEQTQINQSIKMINEYDYDKFSVCNMNTEDVFKGTNEGLNKELQIDWKKDFYGKDHVNSIGNQKTTKYLMNFIKKQVDVKDKRGDKKYVAWDNAYAKYKKLMDKGWEKAKTLKPLASWQKVGGWTEESWSKFKEDVLSDKKAKKNSKKK